MAKTKNTTNPSVKRKYTRQPPFEEKQKIVDSLIKLGVARRQALEKKRAKQQEVIKLMQNHLAKTQKVQGLSKRIGVAFYKQLAKKGVSLPFVTEIIRCINLQTHGKRFTPNKQSLHGLSLDQATQIIFYASDELKGPEAERFREEISGAYNKLRV